MDGWKEQLSKIRNEFSNKPKLPPKKERNILSVSIIKEKSSVDLPKQRSKIISNKDSLQELKIKYGVEYIFHMTHIDNLRNILKNGLLAHNNPCKKIDISNSDVNERRDKIEDIYKKNIHDYIPFYFNVRNAMLYKTQKEFGDNIIILIFESDIIGEDGVIFTNKNAATDDVIFSKDISKLLDNNFIEWEDVRSSSWNNYGNPDEALKQTMMSEVLVPDNVSSKKIKHICCQANYVKLFIENCYEVDPTYDISVCSNKTFFLR